MCVVLCRLSLALKKTKKIINSINMRKYFIILIDFFNHLCYLFDFVWSGVTLLCCIITHEVLTTFAVA